MSAGLLAVCDDVDTGSEFVSDTFDELDSGTDELLLWVLVSDSAELVGVTETLIVGTLDEPVFSQPVSVSSIAAAAANAIAFVYGLQPCHMPEAAVLERIDWLIMVCGKYGVPHGAEYIKILEKVKEKLTDGQENG